MRKTITTSFTCTFYNLSVISAQSSFLWFQKFSIPEKWEVTELNKIVNLQTGYPFKSETFSESGVRLLKGSNVLVQRIDWEDVDYYPTTEQDNFKDYLLQDGG